MSPRHLFRKHDSNHTAPSFFSTGNVIVLQEWLLPNSAVFDYPVWRFIVRVIQAGEEVGAEGGPGVEAGDGAVSDSTG